MQIFFCKFLNSQSNEKNLLLLNMCLHRWSAKNNNKNNKETSRTVKDALGRLETLDDLERLGTGR